MNIKELMEWRHDCFFCHEELTILLEIYGIEATCSIENNFFIIKSDSMSLSINIETGKLLDPEKDKIMVDEFLQRSNFKIVCKCLSCANDNQSYKYSGTISFSYRGVDVVLFHESVFNNNYIFNQWQEPRLKYQQYGSITIVKEYSGKKLSIGNMIRTPFLDLKRLTPEKLEHKLKTYIVFS